ncbi:hypothetical protein TWF506_011157 [Arthrobotrys conoides]|uniref:Uncharacterized protein n=1 Tax=Arthrobotrys conoides TaxID=74498 RepID=A0AAN8RN32_9PEZI
MSLPSAFDPLVWDIVFDIALEIFARRMSGCFLGQLYDLWGQEDETGPRPSASAPSNIPKFTTAIWAIESIFLASEPLETLGARVIPHILDINAVDGEELWYFLTAAITL